MRAVPKIALDFIKLQEGVRLKLYLDGGGVLTGGWGHTGAALGVRGANLTLAQAEAWLDEDLGTAAGRISGKIDGAVKALSEHQYAALLSFVFNLGTGNPKKKEWAIWGLLRAGDLAAIPAQFRRFVNDQDPKTGKPRMIPGLVSRREREVALWSTPDDTAPVLAAPSVVVDHTGPAASSVTRNTETPPTPAPVSPVAKVLAVCTTACSAVPVMAKQVQDVITPYSDQAPIVAHAMVALGTVAAGAAAGLWALNHFQHHVAKA